MMVASIGMQFFNNYANNKKSREIQEHQREFQKAAAEHDFERMRKAHAAAAKLALELDAELHNDRLKDIEGNYNSLLKNFAHGFAISNWPLSVLPFIMKGESFGFLFGGSSKSISIHCILTPSNCDWFNEYFYDDLDLRVQAEMNNNWNAQSTHPVVYYGGGWNRRQNNSNGKSIPSLIDLDDIALLKNKLNQIPTMVITPYFDPYLHFRIQLWGMGKEAEMPFRIDIPHGKINPSDRVFTYDYNKNNKQKLTDGFFNLTMAELVPYLEKLIGFVADKYFWNIYGIVPIFPQIAKSEALLFFDESDKKNLYLDLIDCIDKNTIIAHGTGNLLRFLNKTIDSNDEKNSLWLVRKALCQVCNSRLEDNKSNADNIEDFLNCGYFGVDDLSFLRDIMSILEEFKSKDSEYLHKMISILSQDIVSRNDNTIDHFFPFITLHGFLNYFLKNVICKHGECDTLVIDLSPKEQQVTVYYIDSEQESQDIKCLPKYNYRIDGFLVPVELKEKSPKQIKIKTREIQNFMDRISFDCDVNLFYSVLNLERIANYCRELIDDVKSCSLYVKDGIPKEVKKNIDGELINNLMFCEIESWNKEVIQQLFYYDSLEGELKDKLLLTNYLIIQ